MNEEEMDANTFLRSLEEQNGGPLEWKTYAFYIGASGDRSPRSLGGLIYAVAGKIIFEDFERENTLFKLFGRKRKYEKFKIEAPLDSIRELRSISASDAKRVVNGKTDASKPEPLSGLRKILSKRTEALIFDDGSAWFFEMYDHNGLRALLEK
jgi:hypothetical protein